MELNVEVEVSSVALDEGFDVIVKVVEGFVDGDGGTFVVVSVETEYCLELQQGLPKYEDIELHTILPPYSPSMLLVADYPPKYEV